MREMKRYGVIQSLLEKKMTAGEAASALNVSTCQIKRIKKKVQQCGALGVLHGNKGRPPGYAVPSEFRLHVIEPVKTRYYDFNFFHLSEILAEREAIRVNYWGKSCLSILLIS
ncbi:MAG: hypothetical protein JRI22_08655 [Deltaproteobacteria bacterium]|nr:hypothetical protein [Deltaproteobacteria bacterium]